MNLIKLIAALILFPVMIDTTFAQDLKPHQWKDRLILIFAEDTTNVIYQKQLEAFKREETGMKDRKLVVYEVMPKQYRKDGGRWISGEALFQKYKSTDTPSEIILIGLDGGIKLRQTKVLSGKELFGIIDAMPMRKAELQRKRN